MQGLWCGSYTRTLRIWGGRHGCTCDVPTEPLICAMRGPHYNADHPTLQAMARFLDRLVWGGWGLWDIAGDQDHQCSSLVCPPHLLEPHVCTFVGWRTGNPGCLKCRRAQLMLCFPSLHSRINSSWGQLGRGLQCLCVRMGRLPWGQAPSCFVQAAPRQSASPGRKLSWSLWGQHSPVSSWR